MLTDVLAELTDDLCSAIGSLTNASKIANTLRTVKGVSVSSTTISNYLSYLTESFLFSNAKRYDLTLPLPLGLGSVKGDNPACDLERYRIADMKRNSENLNGWLYRTVRTVLLSGIPDNSTYPDFMVIPKTIGEPPVSGNSHVKSQDNFL